MEIKTLIANLPSPEFKAVMEACIERLLSSSENTRLTAMEKQMCAVGERIKCVKSIRERLGVGLKEAKDIMDREYPKPNLEVLNAKYKTWGNE